ncbi:MAG TPA: efflux RND transporter periplasmic adaptor subunit [Thermoanaerobaculia bacterium]|nr:efflux RND transporter periplasmic adaptor subunit [Thermoanaerobaculia bacterium]
MRTQHPLPHRRGLLAAFAAGLLLAACQGGPVHEASQPPDLDAVTATAERLEVPRTVEIQGSLAAERTASLSARVMAPVTAVRVAAGDRVSRGQALVDIDPQAARGQLAQAQGALEQARAALALAERNHRRYQALAERDAAAEMEVDVARMEHERAAGAVAQAEGAVAAASAVAADSTVVAPFDGRVVARRVEVGDLAAPGRPLLVVESQGARRARFEVPESTVAATALAVGSEVTLSVDARPGLGALTGRVVEMSPGADPATHAFELQVALPDAATQSEPPLASGSAVRAALPVGRRTAVAVPAAALLHRGGLELVVVVGDGGGTTSRAVTTGDALADGRVEILSGLAGGETVVVGLAAVPPAGSRVAGHAGAVDERGAGDEH